MDPARIRHTVTFALAHAEGSDAERDFLAAAQRLASIPGVEAFEVLDEVGSGKYRFGLSMEFADRATYDAYSNHPDHVRFVDDRWPEVTDFLELDYAAR